VGETAIHSEAYTPCAEESTVPRLRVLKGLMRGAVEQAVEIGTHCIAGESTGTAARKEERGLERAGGMGRCIVPDSSLPSYRDELDRRYGHPLDYHVMTHN
jgi:hypothetical protein